MDFRAPMAGRLYADAATAARPQKGGASPGLPQKDANGDFAQSLQKSALDTLRQVRGAEETAKAGIAGRADAQSVVQALAETELAVQTATTVRDKVVSAYNEILRMPV